MSDLYVRDAEMHATAMDDELVMMDPAHGEYYALSGVAARVWELLSQPTDLDSLCAAVTEEFDVDTATCRPDIERFLAQLVDRDLVSAVPHGS